ncbi:PstS family phosphate ABC transporter substrate-binding protein [Desulfuribacillus alkaliarsenatis]|uniref:PBP domain-containing protein n=1 Tax=Desulfuribacillus alkaliarsenatis TaxID=766136 RepID=A0A1E5FYL5_9FIRM|nr:PstS family phosphate ABC transporter substrate-binding protein [Desulfuribacillus alkaliarsenatis]OEF95591.1 hypothetical protein BHF68_12120 [Desulfuribacillus alkaliarsenatis]
MLKRIAVLGLIAALMLLIVACGGGNSEPSNNQQPQQPSSPSTPAQPAEQLPSGFLDVRGSDTMVNMGQALAEYYMDNVNQNANLAVTGGGSGTGIAGLINNDLDIAQSSRAIRQSELDDATGRGVDVHEFIVGVDGVAIGVNSANPIESVTMQELSDILTGAITNWSQLGWAEGGEITVYSRQSNSGTYAFVNEVVMDGADWAPNTQFLPGSSNINEALQTDVAGLGYFGVAYVGGETRALMVDGYSPQDEQAVGDGLYKVARPLFFYVNGTPEGLANHYLQWVLSAEGQAVIAEVGFYRVDPATAYDSTNKELFRSLGIEVTY